MSKMAEPSKMPTGGTDLCGANELWVHIPPLYGKDTFESSDMRSFMHAAGILAADLMMFSPTDCPAAVRPVARLLWPIFYIT